MSQNLRIVKTAIELEELLCELVQTLEHERSNLTSLEPGNLSTLVARKNELLQSLSIIPQHLSSQVTAPVAPGDELSTIARIRKLIAKCQSYNKENGALVAQGLKVCRNSIALLNGNLSRPVVELYDVNGHTNSNPGKRYHGIA
ncbi:MAG: flagellar export chaperone FlgN [Pseudomonadales bacterium]